MDSTLEDYVDELVMTQDYVVYAKWEKIRSSSGSSETEIKEPKDPDEDEKENETEVEEPLFPDVNVDDWFYDGVKYVVENDIMYGMNGIFAPYNDFTREMLAVVLYNIEGKPEINTDIISFSDVKPSMWYTDAVLWANKNGLIVGFEKDFFGIGSPITREQFVSILYRYANWKGYDITQKATLTEYTDFETVSDYAKDPMMWAIYENIITGTSKTTLGPKDTANRAQIAVMTKNFFENVVK